MNIFSIDLTLSEIQLMRQSLDIITISGKDAKALASLQAKLESEIESIQVQLKEFELQKQQDLLKALELDKKSKASRKSE